MASVAIQIGIALLISYLSAKLLAPDIDSPVQDSKPTPLAERNSPLPFLLGRAQIAPVYLWAGARIVGKERSKGGKGFGDDIKTDIYLEGGWHGLCLGPAYRLHKILQNGKPIKVNSVTAESHPSGSSDSVGKEGTYRLYWGEQNQPESSYLDTQLGILSRWPFLTYVEWDQKRLGTSPTWPRLAYEIEVRPFNPKLVGSSPWIKTARTLNGFLSLIFVSPNHLGGPGGTNRIIIGGGAAARSKFLPGFYCKVENNTGGVPDGDYLILDCIKFQGDQNQLLLQSTIPTPVGGLGFVRAYDEDEDDGINAAHAIYQLLFEPYPHGLGRDPSKFDIDSLEEIGVLMETEGIRTVLFSSSSDNIDALLAQLLQDIGVMVALDPRTGLYRFMPLRASANIAAFPEKVLSGPPIEYERLHLDLKATTRVVFTFRDRNRDFSKMSITIDDDGIASLVGGVHGADTVRLPTVGDFESASIVSLRRNQERVAGKQPYRIRATREARLLMPGQLFTVPSVPDVLLCTETALKKPGDTEAKISALPNFYGISASSAILKDGGGMEPTAQAAADALAVIPLEIPEILQPNDGKIRMGIAIVRAHAQISRSDIHLSADDVTFFKVSEEAGVHIGGTFNSAISVSDVGLGTTGFEFTELGPDIAQVLDLTPAGQRSEWRRGRQLILTQAGEIMFLRGVTSLGGTQWRAEQVLRGKLDSVRQSHAAGDKFIILADDQLATFTDILLQPGDTVYFKIQPQAADSLALDEIDSIAFSVFGKGTRPQAVRNLRAHGTDNRYSLGEDVPIDWGYLSEIAPQTGAGEQGAGTAIPVPAAPDGTFSLRIRNPGGGAVVRTVTGLTSPSYNYTWANIAADFSIPPLFSGNVDFDVEVDYVKGSLVSPTNIILVNGSGTAP